MKNIITSSGIFIYPLGLCSILMVFILIERFIALRKRRIIPVSVLQDIQSRNINKSIENTSVIGRIINFYKEKNPNTESLKAYAKYEVSKLERGIYILDIITSAAPLLGLLGTVTGLVTVFANFSSETSPESDVFIQGIAMALTTTLIGLTIAIPSLVGSGYLMRRVEYLGSQLELAIESILDTNESNN